MIKNFQRLNNLKDDGVLGPITAKAMNEFLGICSAARSAHYIGQCAHESLNFTKSKEGLNYSVDGLMKTFGRHRISEEDCEKYGRSSKQPANQVAIGNIVYGGEWGRKNLGNTKPGDGYKFRGHGPLHMTGRANFTAFAKSVQNPCIIENPDLIITDYYFESALFFFNENKLWRFCDVVNDQSILTVSRAINLGNPYSKGTPHGMADRKEKTYSFYEKLLK